MPEKRANKTTQSTREKIASATKKSVSNRIYVQKHSDVMEYLYDSESSEIEAMIESAKKVANLKK